MSESLHAFFAKRLADAAKALAGNGFSVSVAGNPQAARELALAEARALPQGASVSFGGSKTLHDLEIGRAHV